MVRSAADGYLRLGRRAVLSCAQGRARSRRAPWRCADVRKDVLCFSCAAWSISSRSSVFDLNWDGGRD